MVTTTLLEKNLLPDALIRQGIRRLLRQRLEDEDRGGPVGQQTFTMDLLRKLGSGPIAVQTGAANEQHYEVPTAFYQRVLGKRLKYSSGLWEGGATTLDQSEEAMLATTCARAELVDGQDVLELGCGWGSLTLWMAEHFPKSRITAVSNSRTQKAFIDGELAARKLLNVRIVTADMNVFEAQGPFDRVVSVEMFEHMRNHRLLMEKISSWLKPGGKLFVHIFVHKALTYLFDVRDESDWMSKYFFTGGIMPSDHWLLYFQDHLRLEDHWRVSGEHYQKTSEAWLKNMDASRRELMPLFAQTYGEAAAPKWWSYWRIFFMSCAELWGFRDGSEWFVSHYRFQKK